MQSLKTRCLCVKKGSRSQGGKGEEKHCQENITRQEEKGPLVVSPADARNGPGVAADTACCLLALLLVSHGLQVGVGATATPGEVSPRQPRWVLKLPPWGPWLYELGTQDVQGAPISVPLCCHLAGRSTPCDRPSASRIGKGALLGLFIGDHNHEETSAGFRALVKGVQPAAAGPRQGWAYSQKPEGISNCRPAPEDRWSDWGPPAPPLWSREKGAAPGGLVALVVWWLCPASGPSSEPGGAPQCRLSLLCPGRPGPAPFPHRSSAGLSQGAVQPWGSVGLSEARQVSDSVTPSCFQYPARPCRLGTPVNAQQRDGWPT